MRIESFLACFERPRKIGRNWLVRCPAHADRSPSLSIREGDDGRILLRCWSGCSAAEIVGALGLKLADLFPDRMPNRDALREAERRRAGGKRLRTAQIAEAALFQRAQSIIDRAKGLDISSLSEMEFDHLMDLVGAARLVLLAEDRESRIRALEGV